MSKYYFIVIILITTLSGCKSDAKAKALREEALNKRRQHNFTGALEELSRAISYEEYPIGIEEDSDAITWTYIIWASEKTDSNDFIGAIDLYSKLIQINKNPETYYLKRSECKEVMHDYTGALIDADSFLIYVNKNNTYGDNDEGARKLGMTKKDDYVRGWKLKANINFALKRYNDMLTDYQKAIQYTYEDTSKSQLYIVMSKVALQKLNDYNLSLKLTDCAIRYDSTKFGAYVYKAMSFLALKRNNDACIAIRKAASLNPNVTPELVKLYCK